MLYFDRALAVLLILGGFGHTYGVLDAYRNQPDALFWALCGSLLIFLLAALNLLRSWRPSDRALAWITSGAMAGYLVSQYFLGRLFGNMLDPRVLSFGAVSLLLLAFGLRTALGRTASE